MLSTELATTRSIPDIIAHVINTKVTGIRYGRQLLLEMLIHSLKAFCELKDVEKAVEKALDDQHELYNATRQESYKLPRDFDEILSEVTKLTLFLLNDYPVILTKEERQEFAYKLESLITELEARV